MTFAVAMLRRRSRSSGTSGDRVRASMTRNAHSSAAAAASRPVVLGESEIGADRRQRDVHDRVDREHERGGDRDRAGDVQARARGRAATSRNVHERQGVDRDADRQVDEEHPMPANGARDDAAQQHPDAAATSRNEADEAHRLRAVRRIGEQRHHQRQAGGGNGRTAQPLCRATDHEDRLRRRDA